MIAFQCIIPIKTIGLVISILLICILTLLLEILGQSLYYVWQALCSAIDEKYDMEQLWNTGGKKWTYEYKYRRGGKTLCSLYAKRN